LISPIMRWSPGPGSGIIIPEVTLLTTHNFRSEFAHKGNYDALINNMYLAWKRGESTAAVVRAAERADAGTGAGDGTGDHAGNYYSSTGYYDDVMADAATLYTSPADAAAEAARAAAGAAFRRTRSSARGQQAMLMPLGMGMCMPGMAPSGTALPFPPPPLLQQQVEVQEEEEEEEDVPCEICDDKEWEPGNEMLLCDGICGGLTCGKGYHMRCLGLNAESLPSTWYGPCCRSNKKVKHAGTGGAATAAPAPAAAGARAAASSPAPAGSSGGAARAGVSAVPAGTAAAAAAAGSSSTMKVGDELLVMILAEGSQHLLHARVAHVKSGSNVVELDLLHPCAKSAPITNETRKRMRLMAAPRGVAFEVGVQRDDGTPCKPPTASHWHKGDWMRITDGRCKHCGDADSWRTALEAA
jgi:hypothetical protein